MTAFVLAIQMPESRAAADETSPNVQPKPRVEILWSVALKRLRDRYADFREAPEIEQAKEEPSKPVLDLFDKTKDELATVVQQLSQKGDPNLKIVLRPSPVNYQTSTIVYPGQGVELWMGIGSLAFTHDVNELAGMIAYQLANSRSAYQRALAQRLVIAQVREGPDARRRVTDELTKMNAEEKKGATIDGERRRLLKDSLQLMEMIDQQETRDQLEIQTLRQLRVNLDVSDKTKRRILAAKEAIDRMVAAGFDPWKILGPRKRFARIEEMADASLDDHLRRFFGLPMNSNETINLEMEFIRSYVAYLEKKKVNLLNQPYRGVMLPARLAALHYVGTTSQLLSFQGVAKFYAGAGGAALGVGAYVLVGRQGAAEVAKEKATMGAGNATRDYSSLNTVRNVLNYSIAGAGLLGVAASVELGVRAATTNLRLNIGKFPSRYADQLSKAFKTSDELKRVAEKENPTSTEVLRALNAYKDSTLFMMDGIDPQVDRVRMRNLYVYLYEAPRISLYRLARYEERKGVKKDPAVEALIEEVEEEAKLRIAERKGGYDERRDRRELKRETEKMFKEKYVYGNSQAKDLKGAGVSLAHLDGNLNTHSSSGAQRFIYGLFGRVATLYTSANTAQALEAARRYLEQASPTDPGKAAVLEKLSELAALQYLGAENQEKYLTLMEKHSPNLPLLSKPLGELVAQKPEIAPTVFQTLLHYKATQDLSPQDTIVLLRELVISRKYFPAAKLLLRRFDKVIQQNGRETFELISEILEKAPRDFGNPLLKRPLVNAIMARALVSMDKNQLVALWSHLDLAGRTPITKTLFKPAVATFDAWLLRREGAPEEQLQELVSKLDVLNSVGATRQMMAERVSEAIKNKPLSMGDIDAVLEREYLWKHLQSEGELRAKSAIEHNIMTKYQALSKKYPAFLYDPKASETVQKVLLAEFRRNQPGATLEETFGFWTRLVARGATGVTDAMFDDLFHAATDPKVRRQWAENAFNDHLLWDKNLSGQLYKELNEKTFDGTTLQKEAEARVRALQERLRSLATGQGSAPDLSTSKKRAELTRELLKTFSTIFAYPSGEEKKEEKRLRAIFGHMPLSPERFEQGRKQLLNYLGEGKAAVRRAKFGFIEAQKNSLLEQFSDGGPALVDLLDWTAKKLQTDSEQTFFVKNQITAIEDVKGDDLGYSTVNKIVEEAVHWEKEEKWALIRWLRGSGPPPMRIKKMFGSVGDETVRRLYSGMPIHVRRVFMAAILDSAKKSLLTGGKKMLFEEQILNELLPANKASAEIAHDLLRAFLKSVEQVSSPEKRTLVLSHLLANHREGGASVGVVLRNVLEAYGPVGVKFGQLLAASDVLPEEIRKELAKLRDGANEPRLYEIYEDLQRILKTKNTDALFRVKRLLGSASMKYGILVEEASVPKPRPENEPAEQVFQVKREEARVAIAADLAQLRLIIEDLVKEKPSRYAFLQGIGSAVKDAIIRELSLARENEKSETAKKLYENLEYGKDVDVQVPANTTLVSRLPGPKSRVHALRGAAFVNGKPIDQFPEEQQRKFARVILSAEDQILFPNERDAAHPKAKNRPKEVFDSDRHPGNILVDEKTGRVQFFPIDWGQLLDLLTPEAHSRVIKLMAYSQLLELLGPQDALMRKMVQDFGLEPKVLKALQSDLYKNFPNRESHPRSALGGYYFLLAQLEKHDFAKNVVHYDLLRAIYQLEPYEALLKDEPNHRSPKASFGHLVEAQAKALAAGLRIETSEKIKLALRRPWTAAIVQRNAALAKEDKLALDGFLAHLSLSRKSRQPFLDHYPSDPQSGEEFLRWFSKVLQGNADAIPEAEKKAVRAWLDSPALEKIEPSSFTAAQFFKVAAQLPPGERAGASTKMRKVVSQPPIQQNPFTSVVTVYSAELISAVFWALWDRDPVLAQSWIKEMMHLEKHLGFGAFAVAATVYDRIVTSAIPMSLQFTRYVSGKGVSMGVGMIAADVVRRIYNGQSVRDVTGHVASSDNLKEVGYGVLTFMAADVIVERAAREAQKIKAKVMSPPEPVVTCQKSFSRIALLGGTFIVAEGLNRAGRPYLEEAGILKSSGMVQKEAFKEEFLQKFQELEKRFDQAVKERDGCKAMMVLVGTEMQPCCAVALQIDRFGSFVGDAPESFARAYDQYRTQLRSLAQQQGGDEAAKAWADQDAASVRLATTNRLFEKLPPDSKGDWFSCQ